MFTVVYDRCNAISMVLFHERGKPGDSGPHTTQFFLSNCIQSSLDYPPPLGLVKMMAVKKKAEIKHEI